MKRLQKATHRTPRMLMRQKTMRFPFAWTAYGPSKTAQCCLEKFWVRTIEWQTNVNSLQEHFQANHEK